MCEKAAEGNLHGANDSPEHVCEASVTVDTLLRACFCSTDGDREAQDERSGDHERGVGHVR